MKDTENMAEQRTADVRTVGWSLRQKEVLGIVLDAIQSLRSRARVFPEIFELLVNFQIVFDQLVLFANSINDLRLVLTVLLTNTRATAVPDTLREENRLSRP